MAWFHTLLTLPLYLLRHTYTHTQVQSLPTPVFMLWRVELNAPERKRSWSVTHRNEFLHTHAVFPTYMRLYIYTHTHTCHLFKHKFTQLLSPSRTHTYCKRTRGERGSNDIQALTHFTQLFSAPSLQGLPFIPAGYTGCHTGSWGGGTKTWMPQCVCVFVWIQCSYKERGILYLFMPPRRCSCLITARVFSHISARELTEKGNLFSVCTVHVFVDNKPFESCISWLHQ